MKISERKKEIEIFVRGGKSDQARALLLSITARRVPREEVATIAGLARRAALPDLAIRILHPIVRGEAGLSAPSTELEKSEYAASLLDVGGQAEAIGILRRIDPQTVPQALLFYAFALFTYWNYKDAIPILERYLSLQTDEYSRLVGRINLAAALVYEAQAERARTVLSQATSAARKLGGIRLLGNSLQLSALLAITLGNEAEAQSYLGEASNLLMDPQSIDRLRVKKWQAVLGKEPGAIREVRGSSQDLRDWESVRDCDFYLALVEHDQNLLRHLYFGTPYQRYREKILAQTPSDLPMPENYLWKLGAGEGRIFDLEEGRIAGEKGEALQESPLLIHLAKALSLDFYRPVRVATLFSLLFPKEYFNPTSSPHRIHEAVRRLRQFFRRSGIPLEVDCIGGAYRLAATQPIAIGVTSALEDSFKRLRPLELLESSFGSRPFSCVEAARALGLSPRSTLRILDSASPAEGLVRLGKGSATRYQLKTAA